MTEWRIPSQPWVGLCDDRNHLGKHTSIVVLDVEKKNKGETIFSPTSLQYYTKLLPNKVDSRASQFESCVFCRQTFLSVLLRRALPIFVICHVFVMSVVQLHQSVILVFRQGCRHQKESYLCSWPIWSPQHQYIQKLKCMLFSHSNQKDRKYIISFLVNYFYASSFRHMMFSTEKNKIFTLWQAFLVAKDFGARPAYYFALHHPSRTCGVVFGDPLPSR